MKVSKLSSHQKRTQILITKTKIALEVSLVSAGCMTSAPLLKRVKEFFKKQI